MTWDDVIFVTLTLQAGAARAGIHKSRPGPASPSARRRLAWVLAARHATFLLGLVLLLAAALLSART